MRRMTLNWRATCMKERRSLPRIPVVMPCTARSPCSVMESAFQYPLVDELTLWRRRSSVDTVEADHTARELRAAPAKCRIEMTVGRSRRGDQVVLARAGVGGVLAAALNAGVGSRNSRRNSCLVVWD